MGEYLNLQNLQTLYPSLSLSLSGLERCTGRVAQLAVEEKRKKEQKTAGTTSISRRIGGRLTFATPGET